jgi:hypothetical protein
MLATTEKYLERFIDKTAFWILFFLGIWLVVINHLAQIGDWFPGYGGWAIQ